MSDYSPGGEPQPNPSGYQQPISGPVYGGQPTSGPAYGLPGPSNQVTPYQQHVYPGYAAPPYGQPAGYGQQQYDQYGRPLSDKTKIIAGLLGILLGGFGAGRFYTGHTGIAVAQLLVTVFTCGLGHFWGLIDGIMLLVNGGTDAQGRILRSN